MRVRIDGKRYNTETAKYIGNATDGLGESDFSYYNEDLYRKRTGEFFLAGEGGAMTEYGDSGWYGYGIIPLTLTQAKKWSEKNLDVDEYIDVFGDVEE